MPGELAVLGLSMSNWPDGVTLPGKSQPGLANPKGIADLVLSELDLLMEQLESKSYPCKFIRSADPQGKKVYPLRIDPTKDFPQPLSTIKPLSFSVHHPHSTPPIPVVAACLSMETSITTVPRGSQRLPEAPQEPNPSPEPREDDPQRSTPTGSDNRATSRQGHPARNQRTASQSHIGVAARIRTFLRTMTTQQ
jgi:hypothetical protein